MTSPRSLGRDDGWGEERQDETTEVFPISGRCLSCRTGVWVADTAQQWVQEPVAAQRVGPGGWGSR